MTKKLLSVDNLDVVRDFVFSTITNETDALKTELSDETQAYLIDKLTEAEDKIRTDYESKHNELLEKLEQFKQEGVNQDAITDLELQIEALKSNYNDMLESLEAVKESVKEIGDSVMSEGQLNELIQVALIKETTITDDMVTTPNLFATNLVALIAKFGTIRALNIIGDEIQGKTISNYNGNEEPIWKLDKDGDGYLANKNIEWDKDGNVTFGPKVKVKWSSVVDDNGNTPQISGGHSEEEIKKWVTEITDSKLKTFEIEASKITGDTISGKTVQAINPNAWRLENSGAGTLANGNISWNPKGVVSFGPDVKFKWSSVVDDNGNTPQISGGHSEEEIKDWATEITDSKLKTFEIEASKITGDTISGKTLQSTTNTTLLDKTTGPTWQIRNEGDGYLSAGHISWDNSGNLTVNGTINGKIGQSTGDIIGPWKVSEDNGVKCIYNGKSLKSSTYLFADDGTFRIGGQDNIVSNPANTKSSGITGVKGGALYLGNYNEGYGMMISRLGNITIGKNVTMKWGDSDSDSLSNAITTISNNVISTAKITAEQIETENLSVKKLNTTGSETGKRITIVDNDVSIYTTENGSDVRTCRITNESIGNMSADDLVIPNGKHNILFTSSENLIGDLNTKNLPNDWYNTSINNSYGKQKIAYLYKGNSFKLTAKIYISNLTHTNSSVKFTGLNFGVKLFKNNDTTSLESEKISLYSLPIETNPPQFKEVLQSVNGQPAGGGKKIDFEYTIDEEGVYYFEPYISGQWTAKKGDGVLDYDVFSIIVSGEFIKETDDRPTSVIFSDAAVFLTENGGIAVDKNMASIKSGNSQIVLKDDRIYIAFGDTNTIPRMIRPVTHKFHVDGKNQYLTVLTI